MRHTGRAESVNDRLALALDTNDLPTALDWARGVQGIFGVVKVGLELFSAVGPRSIDPLLDMGFKVFLDLKLHDIPNTVEKASRAVASFGVSYLTVHSCGGEKMVEAALRGLIQGSETAGTKMPMLLGVTILTSDEAADRSVIGERLSILSRAGARGLVCAATDLDFVSSFGPKFFKVVPGIRREMDQVGDQVRVSTPAAAISAGADLLVIGRPITTSSNPAGEAGKFRNCVAETLNYTQNR